MLLTIHQPEHLPWQGFFHKMAAADCFVVLDNVQYRHHYFQNRNRILAREPMWLTVPVLRGDSHYGRIDQVLIENTQAWRHKYWKSIEQNYRSHPHYERYEGALQKIIHTPFDRLIDLNLALIDFFRDALGITCPMVRASTLEVSGAKSELLRQICLRCGADHYLSGPSGVDYLDESLFRASGIQVRFHSFLPPVYPQFGTPFFTPLLSTLDLLMNCGPSSRTVLLGAMPGSEQRPSLGAS